MILCTGVTVINFISGLITGTPGKEKKEEDPEKEGDFPENCLFRLVHNYAHRMAAGGEEGKDTRKSQEAISYANRRLTETEVFKEAPLEDGRRGGGAGRGRKRVIFPSFFYCLFGAFWVVPLSFLLSRFGKDSFLQLLLRERGREIDRCLRGSGIRRH